MHDDGLKNTITVDGHKPVSINATSKYVEEAIQKILEKGIKKPIDVKHILAWKTGAIDMKKSDSKIVYRLEWGNDGESMKDRVPRPQYTNNTFQLNKLAEYIAEELSDIRSNHKMNVSIYSRETIERQIADGFPANMAVISFYDPEDKKGYGNCTPVDYHKQCERIFYVCIHDIDFEILGEYGLNYDTYFPEADELAGFIIQAQKDGLDIICQCEYGQSRSAACAAAILEFFYHNGISIFADYRYYPNQMVFHKVFDALGKFSPEEIEIHLTLWSSVVKKYIKDTVMQQNVIAEGYKSIERGRVIYNTATMKYEITCSEKMIHDTNFRKNIIAHYQLAESSYEFVQLNHYYKIELTGNPMLDEYIENSQL